jgi:hypothetical protein
MIDSRPSCWDWPRIFSSRKSVWVLSVAAVLSLGAIAIFWIDIRSLSLAWQAAMGWFGALAALGAVVLWVAMGFYWLRCDSSSRASRSIWFFALLFGFCYATIPYYLLVYLPAFRRGQIRERQLEIARAEPILYASQRKKIGAFGNVLILGWVLLFATVALAFTFPKSMSHLLGPVASFIVLWPAALLFATAIYLIARVLRL